MKQSSTLLRIILPLVILGLAVLGAQLLIASRPDVPKASRGVTPTFVEVITVREQDTKATITAFGTIQAHQQLTVQPEVSGRVTRLNPNLVIGGTLKRGESLLHIDPRDFRFAVDEQRAAFAKAQFDLKVELGNQAVAKREWNLLKPSKGEVNALSKQLALRRPHLEEKRMALAAARSRLHKAQLDLKRTILRTPFPALVLEESVEVGQLIHAQTAVATLVGTSEFRVQVSIPIQQLERITFPGPGRPQGSPVQVIREIGTQKPVIRQGSVVELLGDVTENGRMAQVLVSVIDPLELQKPNDQRRPLLIGEYVRVEIEGPLLRNVIALPREAIREGNRAWIKNNEDRLELRDLVIELSKKDTVLIREGLHDGEQVIISQLSAAVPGLLVRTDDSPVKQTTTNADSEIPNVPPTSPTQ